MSGGDGGEGTDKNTSGLSKKELNKLKRKEGKAAGKAAGATGTQEEGNVGDATSTVVVVDKFPLVSIVVASMTNLQLANKKEAEIKVEDHVLRGDQNIARYLARKAKKFYGQDSVDPELTASLIDEWMERSNEDIALEFLDEHLASRTYVAGHSLSLADMFVWARIIRQNHQASVGSFTNVSRWFASLELSAFSMAKALYAKKDKEVAPKDPFKLPALPQAEQGKVVTRFPPEPSGHLHIGHVKAMYLNKYYAERYGGRMLVRFDDTNPSKEKVEYEEGIIEDLHSLGINFTKVSYTSDYFDLIIDLSIKLIKEGKAYMDDTPQEQMSEERRTATESKRRNESVEDNLERFLMMLWKPEEALEKGKALGVFKSGKLPENHAADDWCLRAKIDMASKNKALCDPVIFRSNDEPHARTKTKYRAYPTYDLACPIVDSVEGVTHAMRDIQYRDRAPLYYWMFEAMGLRKVLIQDFSRLNFVYTLLSKRNLKWFVDSGRVPGWDDPRFPTVKGIIRRGMQLDALYEFMVSQGASKNIIDMEWDKFWSLNKKHIERTAPRYMGVSKDNHIETLVKNEHGSDMPESVKQTPNHPKDTDGSLFGFKELHYGPVILLEEEDCVKSEATGWEQIKEGERIVLTQWGVMEVTKVELTGDKITKIEIKFVPDGDVKSPQRKIHWVKKSPACVSATMFEFDYLITKSKLEENEDFKNFVNPHSIATTELIVEPAVANIKVGQYCQLLRRGFYRVDKIDANGHLDLFTIPDGKTKAMSTMSSKLAHR